VFEVQLICHAWDLVEEGVEEVLDRLAGELGVSGICVPVVCPPLALLRTLPGVSPRIFRTRGGLFFAPREEYYQATRCKPVVSSWLKGRDPLRRIVEGCREHGLSCRAVVATSTVGRMTGRYPHAAAKTVFGDPWDDRLCLVNPDVRSFLVAVCRDLADNYGLTGIELAELHAGRVGRPGGRIDAGFEMGRGGAALLGTCFCESCRQLGQVGGGPALDVDAAVHWTEARLLDVFETGRPIDQPLSRVFAEDGPMRAYVEAQWKGVVELARSIRSAVGCELIVHAYGDAICAAGSPYPLGDGQLPPLVDGVLTQVEGPVGADVAAIAEAGLLGSGPGARAELQIRAHRPDEGAGTPPDPALLVQTLSRLAEFGIASVDLDNYGQIPVALLPGLKQAVRFARRAAPEESERPA